MPVPNDALREALLAAIRADPRDEAPWLIYADYLDDCGEDGALFRRPRFTDAFGIDFVLVPRGMFRMSEEGKHAQHPVAIADDFALGVYPMTQEQWQAVMGSNPVGSPTRAAARTR